MQCYLILLQQPKIINDLILYQKHYLVKLVKQIKRFILWLPKDFWILSYLVVTLKSMTVYNFIMFPFKFIL